jgi:hypothetical protein
MFLLIELVGLPETLPHHVPNCPLGTHLRDGGGLFLL